MVEVAVEVVEVVVELNVHLVPSVVTLLGVRVVRWRCQLVVVV